MEWPRGSSTTLAICIKRHKAIPPHTPNSASQRSTSARHPLSPGVVLHLIARHQVHREIRRLRVREYSPLTDAAGVIA